MASDTTERPIPVARSSRGTGNSSTRQEGYRSEKRTAHLQPVPRPHRSNRPLVGAPLPDRGDALQLGLRQPVPLARVLRQLVRHQRLLPAQPVLPRQLARQRRRTAQKVRRRRARGRYRGDDGSRHQSHRQGRGARHRPPAVVRALFRCVAAYKVPSTVWQRLIGVRTRLDQTSSSPPKPSAAARTRSISSAAPASTSYRTPRNVREMMGLPRGLAARSIRAVSPHRTLDCFSRKLRRGSSASCPTINVDEINKQTAAET